MSNPGSVSMYAPSAPTSANNPVADAPTRPACYLVEVASGVKHDDGAGYFALLQFLEGAVDLRQLDATRDHLVQLELAGHVEVDQARHIEWKAVRSHGRALDAPLAEEGKTVEFDLGAEWNHADDVGGAAARQHAEGLFGRLF